MNQTIATFAALLTPENARQYAATMDKLAFCSDLTGLRVDDAALAQFEDAIEKLALSLEGEMVALRDVKKGEYVRRKEGAKKTYIKGDYCRIAKAYSLTDCDDASREIFVKADKTVHIGFTF